MNTTEKVDASNEDTKDLSESETCFMQYLIKQEPFTLLTEDSKTDLTHILEEEIKSECTVESFVENIKRENGENSTIKCTDISKNTTRNFVECTKINNSIEEYTNETSYLLSCVNVTIKENEENLELKNSDVLQPDSVRRENIYNERLTPYQSNSNNDNIHDYILYPRDGIQDLLFRSMEHNPHTSANNREENSLVEVGYEEQMSDMWRRQSKNVNCLQESEHFLSKKAVKQLKKKEDFDKITMCNVKSYKCDLCGKYFSYKQGRDAQKLIREGVKNFKCEECYKFMLKRNFQRYVALHCEVKGRSSDTEVKNYKCDFCGKCCMKKYSLQAHIMNVHVPASQKVNYKCEFCNKQFTYKQSLQYHIMLHKGKVKKFKCEDCNYYFMKKAELQSHVITHTGSRNYKCFECYKCFFHKQSLRKHIIAHHIEVNVNKCEKCNKVFMTKGNLRKHEIIHTGFRNFNCDFCNKCFTYPQTLRKHKLTHTGVKKYNCEKCGRHFLFKQNLQKHIELHEGIKSNKCLECGKCFTRNDALQKHKAIHTGVKEHKCDQCHKWFYHKSHLKRHKLIIHNSIRVANWKCDLCDHCFTCKNDLKRHKIIHITGKCFKCEKCEKFYTLKNSLKKHKKRIHKEDLNLSEEIILGI